MRYLHTTTGKMLEAMRYLPNDEEIQIKATAKAEKRQSPAANTAKLQEQSITISTISSKSSNTAQKGRSQVKAAAYFYQRIPQTLTVAQRERGNLKHPINFY